MASPAPTVPAALLPSVYISMGYIDASFVSMMVTCRAGCGHLCTGNGMSHIILLCVCVFFYYILLVLSHHATLHCVILHARFVLSTFIWLFIVLFSCSWLFELMSFNICSLIHVSLQFFEVYRVSKICKLF